MSLVRGLRLRVGGAQKWNIVIIPDCLYNGKKAADPKYLGVFLQLNAASSTEKIKAHLVSFSVFHPSSGTWLNVGSPCEHDFGSGQLEWGVVKAAAHADLLGEPSTYLYNGALTVRVDFDFEVADPLRHLAAHCFRLAHFYGSNDFTLNSSDKKEFRVHRSILAARSSVFRGMLKQGTAEQQTGRADITNVDGETLVLLLKYIYYGNMTKVAHIAEKLLQAADKYEILDLRDLAVKLLLVNLTVQDVFRRLTTADQRGLPELKMAAAKFILDYVDIVSQTEDCQQLKEKSSSLFGFIEAAKVSVERPRFN